MTLCKNKIFILNKNDLFNLSNTPTLELNPIQAKTMFSTKRYMSLKDDGFGQRKNYASLCANVLATLAYIHDNFKVCLSTFHGVIVVT